MKVLRELRNQRNLTQREVAEQLGVTQQTYAYYELGQRKPEQQTLIRLADFFEVSADYLLGRTENPSPINDRSAASFAPGVSYEDLPPEAVQQLKDYEAFLREKYQKK